MNYSHCGHIFSRKTVCGIGDQHACLSHCPVANYYAFYRSPRRHLQHKSNVCHFFFLQMLMQPLNCLNLFKRLYENLILDLNDMMCNQLVMELNSNNRYIHWIRWFRMRFISANRKITVCIKPTIRRSRNKIKCSSYWTQIKYG